MIKKGLFHKKVAGVRKLTQAAKQRDNWRESERMPPMPGCDGCRQRGQGGGKRGLAVTNRSWI
jgi:hypothetical protein